MAQPKGRPAFVGKLWQMVNDPANEPYIRWMPDGKSIQVVNREAFEKKLLPKYFKHANFSSFVRQLNMYGWHKVQDLSSGSMNSGDENWQFQSPNFIRDHEELLDRIVRNKGTTKHEEDDDHDISRVVKELEQIKAKQMVIGEELFRMRKDNELLWSEHNQNREKYEQHTQMLDKILHFLASVYGPNAGQMLDGITGPMPGAKRRFITEVADSPPDDTRIQEIREMKDLQDKIKGESSGATTPEEGALVPFNRQMAVPSSLRGQGFPQSGPNYPANQYSAPTGHNNSQLGHGAPTGPVTSAPSTVSAPNGSDTLASGIDKNNADIDYLTNQLAMQDVSLQHVQDWIQNMGGDEDPVNFDVNDFLNSDLEEPVVKEEPA